MLQCPDQQPQVRVKRSNRQQVKFELSNNLKIALIKPDVFEDSFGI